MSVNRPTKETIEIICRSARALWKFIEETRENEDLCIEVIEECLWSWRQDGVEWAAGLMSEVKSPLDELLANQSD